MVRILIYLCLYLFLITLPNTVIAEDWLIKGEAKYLGWQIGKDFIDCKNKPIKIDKGRIEKTDDKCPENGPPHPFVVKGSVEAVNVNNMTFRVKDEKGQSHNFFFRTIEVNETVRLQDLKVGDKVTVTAPMPGRAVAIEINKKDEM